MLSDWRNPVTYLQGANKRLDDARALPEIESFYEGLINLHGTNIIYGNAGIGKSAFTVYLMNELAKTGKKVAYFDFELSEIQFANRYRNYAFSETFSFAVMEGITDPLSFVIEAINGTSEDVYVIDNITYIHDNLTDPKEGGKFIKDFSELMKNKGVVGFLLAHTPKGYEGAPLDMSSLAGAKALSNFASDIIGIGKSYNEQNLGDVIYMKHVKCRNSLVTYHENNIMLRRFAGMMDFPPYESGIGQEHNHIKKKFKEASELKASDVKKVVINELRNLNYKYNEIEEITGYSRRTIAKYCKA